MVTQPRIPGPSVQRVNDAVLVAGQALVDTAVLVAAGLHYQYRTDGISANPRLRNLANLYADAAAAVSASRHADVRGEPVSASSLADEITTLEAAEMLGIGQRQMCRLAPLLGGRRTTAGWLVRRGAVAAHQHERSATR